MTDKELAAIGMTREEWDNSINDELGYVLEWAQGVDSNKI
jgi:hypothetical protein